MKHWNEHSGLNSHQATSSSHKKKSNKESDWQKSTCRTYQVCLPKGGLRNRGYYDERELNYVGRNSFDPSLENVRSVEVRGKSQVSFNGSESNKENFPLTSYHFAVDRNAKIYTKDSLMDFSVEWRDVEAVVIFHDKVEETLCCPVCLDSVRAPRMTKCGHLFCLLCILRFFSFHDMAACKCPLCGKKIRLEDLRQVDIRLVAPCYVGMEQSMRLVIRRKESFIAKPFFRDSWQFHLSDCSIPDDHKEDPKGILMQPIYSRIFNANDERLLFLLERDERDIEQIVKEEPSYIPYADYAMEELIQKKKQLELSIHQQRRDKFFEISSGNDSAVKTDSQSYELDPLQLHEFRFLFQVESGQDVYLHPFSVKCLLDYYEHLCFAPQVIRGKVLEVERCTMTEDLKKRMRFLSHLPLGCEFYFVELDLSSILPLRILNKFAKTIQRRAQERLKREKEQLAFQLERESTPAYEEERKSWFRSEVSVDMSEQSFPSLVGSSNDPTQPSETNTEEDSSSYAAVTSHMGYFPTIARESGSSSGLLRCSWKKSPNSIPQASDLEETSILSSSPVKDKKKKVKVLLSNIPKRGGFD